MCIGCDIMPTLPKIKILDNSELRLELDLLYDTANQIILAKWAISVAKRTLALASIEYISIAELADGFYISELWQAGNAGVGDVRSAAFKIHKLARKSPDLIKLNALRTAGQGVSVGHMPEHAMVCSDYAIKTFGLITNNNIHGIISERQWQINELKTFLQEDKTRIV